MNTKDAANNRRILIPTPLWNHTWSGLRERGHGKVESVGVWAGTRDGLTEHVKCVHFLSDFGRAYQRKGYHLASTRMLADLFARLQKDHHVLIADVHTHPTKWVGLSEIDKQHPIEFRPGIHAIVLPSFARSSPSIARAGIHEYIGNGEWQTLSQKAKSTLLTLT